MFHSNDLLCSWYEESGYGKPPNQRVWNYLIAWDHLHKDFLPNPDNKGNIEDTIVFVKVSQPDILTELTEDNEDEINNIVSDLMRDALTSAQANVARHKLKCPHLYPSRVPQGTPFEIGANQNGLAPPNNLFLNDAGSIHSGHQSKDKVAQKHLIHDIITSSVLSMLYVI